MIAATSGLSHQRFTARGADDAAVGCLQKDVGLVALRGFAG
jgi:hypothetical protein